MKGRELRVRPKDLVASQKGGRLHRTPFFRIFQAVAEKAGLPAEKTPSPLPQALALAYALVAGNAHLVM